MNRDLAKSQAFHDKKRSEVEDGTAQRDRHARVVEKGLELGKLLAINPITSTFDTVEEHLDTIARERGFARLSASFYNRLDIPTREWLAPFLVNPYTTSPKHPALKLCVKGELKKAFRVYIRTYETTVGEERERLKVRLESDVIR
jgi:hypothetical protein